MPEPSGPNSVPCDVPRTPAFQPEGVLAECGKDVAKSMFHP